MKIGRVRRTAATIIHLGDLVILVSYSTPVAYYNGKTGKYFRTSERHSVTTSRHVNEFLAGWKAEEIPQADLDNLLEN